MTGTLRIHEVEPTVFFIREGDALRQQVRVTVANGASPTVATLTVQGGGVDETLHLQRVGTGETVHEVFIPDLRTPAQLIFALQVGDDVHERQVDWTPQKHWEIHMVHFSHHDLGYSDMPTDLRREHAGFIDDVLDMCEQTADWPEASRFRWLVEEAWSVLAFVETRPREAVERLAHFVRQGQVEIGALYGNQIQELCGHEEMIRLLYPSFRLKRDFGIDITSAQHNDIPGFSWGMASTLAGAGIRYFCAALPAWYFVDVHPCWDEEKVLPVHRPGAHRWEGPDGQSVLYWHDPFDEDIWTPTSYRHALRELPAFLAGLEEKGYTYDMVYRPLVSGVRDNSPPTDRFARIAREWNSHWAYPQLITATPTAFFERFEQRWGDSLATLRGDLPGTDYPVCATCTPKETGINRRTHDGLQAAETLATLAALVVDDYEYPRPALDEAYREMLDYDEHCWGMWSPGGPAQAGCWSEKGGFAYRAAALTHDLMIKASNRIVDQIDRPSEGYTVTVFNPLSWVRSDVVRAPLRTWQPHGTPLHVVPAKADDEEHTLVLGGAIGRGLVDLPQEIIDKPFELVDLESGARLPYQIVRTTDPQAVVPWAPEGVATGGLIELVFVADGLPAIGYRTYSIVPCDEWPQFDEPCTATDTTMENAFFRLQLDAERGVIDSLHDKELDQELVDADADHGFGQLIIRDCGRAAEELGRLRQIHLVDTGPLLSTIRLTLEASCCPRVTQDVTLYHTIKRIDVGARILRDSTPLKEVFFAFPFQVDEPQFHYEAPNAVIEPIRDQLPGSNTDYHAVQHWAHVGNEQGGVVWSAIDTPVAEFGGLWPGYVSSAHHQARGPEYGHAFLEPGDLTRGHIYSLVSYNNFNTNFVNAHACEYLARYSLTSQSGGWPAAHSFGWGVANPPHAVWMEGSKTTGTTLPAAASFCQIDAPNVHVLAFKRAEDGRGHILRLAEREGRNTTANVSLPFLSFGQVLATNLVEEDERELPDAGPSVRVEIGSFSIVTLRLLEASPDTMTLL